jgi:hypothetical protein
MEDNSPQPLKPESLPIKTSSIADLVNNLQQIKTDIPKHDKLLGKQPKSRENYLLSESGTLIETDQTTKKNGSILKE